MVITRSRFRKGAVLTAGVVASGLVLASCASSRSSAPEETATSRPSVTYKYNTDDELIQANQRAVTYCNGYNFVPQPANFSNESDGRKVVVFDCVAPTQVAISAQQYNQNSTFNYKSDQELLRAVSRGSTLLHEQRESAGFFQHPNEYGRRQVRYLSVRGAVNVANRAPRVTAA